MADTAKVVYDSKEYDLPVVIGSENEAAIDIAKLRGSSGLITIDPGFKNTGSTQSAITFLDGEKGILRYRGYPIEQLSERSNFLEVSYLLIYGELPTQDQLDNFRSSITEHTLVNEDIRKFFDGYPTHAHPMGILSALVGSLSAFYPDAIDPNPSQKVIDLTIVRLMAKMPTLAAWGYKNSMGHPVIYPKNKLDYTSNFLHMMNSLPAHDYEVDPVVADALDKLFILHADHEQNCSTSTVRMVGSSQASLYSCISAGVSALWGPLHGGANQAVIEMLERIKEDGGNADKWIEKAKDSNDPFRLMGFGHRVYKNFDPRAKIIKKAADSVLEALGINDPTLEIAKKLEETALSDDYFVSRKLFPNVDFYSGIIYRAINIPVNMFTVMFALGRLPGWIAQWKEMRENREPIGRPRQVYIGAQNRDYVQTELR